MSATEAGQFLGLCSKNLGKLQWEWIASARAVSQMRRSTIAAESALEGLLSAADQSMVNAFTGGFRAAQTKLAIAKVLTERPAALALESAQITALAILVREQMPPEQFALHYRPFATVVPGPGYQPPPAPEVQLAAFIQHLKTLSGEAQAEAIAIGKGLSEPPAPKPPPPPPGAPPVVEVAPSSAVEVATAYAAAWKETIAAAAQSGRTPMFRAAQESAENAAPHDGSGMVATAGIAAGGLVMRDLIPIEHVLLLYEPFAAAIPFEQLR